MNENKHSDEQFTLQDFIKRCFAPQWFVLLAVFIYVSGFLCEFTFFDRYGVHETGEEFLRARYIHAGILFLLFPISILVPIILKISIKKAEYKENKKQAAADALNEKARTSPPTEIPPPAKSKPFKFPYSTMVAFFNISAIFYFSIFTPRNFIFARVWLIAVVILVSFIGPLVIDLLVENFIVSHYQKFSIWLRWTLIVAGVGSLDYLMFKGFLTQLGIIFWGKHIFPSGGIYYVFFIIMIPYTMWRSNFKTLTAVNARSRTEIKLVGVSLSLMFCFLGMINFALRVYPQIPAAKGGGNYVESPHVKLTFRPFPNFPAGFDTNNATMVALSTSNSFVIIERTSTSLFLADTTDAEGPEKWVEMRKMPAVIEVRRDIVDQILYTQVTDTNLFPNPYP